MATTTVNYSSNTNITLDLSSLATSSTWVAGVESAEIDNTSNKYMDALVDADAIVGHASTAPTVGQMINVYVWGSDTSLATTAIGALDGTSSAETVTATLLANLRLGASLPVVTATAALEYHVLPFSVAALFGGVMPKYWGLFVAHNHTGALGSSNNSKFRFVGIKYDVA
jgi:hypothetical protein